MKWAEYKVVGKREYRGNPPGRTFIDRLDSGARQRAIVRGDIQFVREVVPELQPGSWTLPDGWSTKGKE